MKQPRWKKKSDGDEQGVTEKEAGTRTEKESRKDTLKELKSL